MAIFKMNDKYVKPAAILSSGLFLCAALLLFLPVGIGHKLVIPLTVITLASLWMCPWHMTAAFLFSALGDYMGSCGNFIWQMAFFATSHIFFISYFVKRYFEKVYKGGKIPAKSQGYMVMLGFCIIALLCLAFIRIAPGTPEGIVRSGVCIYAVVISIMLFTAMVQRSSLYALGAVLFVFSDLILAWNKFVEPVPYINYMVLVSYFLAQWLLFIRSTKFRVAPEMRILRV